MGLLHAIRLGQAGVRTLVLERHHELLPTTRAMVYQPVVLNVLRGLGILDEVKKHAYLNREGIYWRDIKGNQLGHMPLPKNEFVLLFGQKRMTELLLQILGRYDSVQVRFGHEFVGCEQGQKSVKCMVKPRNSDTGDDIFFLANWIVATDGANSSVRKALCVPFEGYTHNDFRMIGADVVFDYAKDNYGTVMNFVMDHEDWAVVIYTGENHDLKADGPPLWRVAYGESNELPDDQASILERAQERVARYAPNHTGRFNITRAEPYRILQRCAAQAIVGRVILAGDALHSNNPIGGLGLTTGILDSYSISNALVRVLANGEPESLMTEAANDRRRAWLDVVSPMSEKNLERLRSADYDAMLERRQYFDKLKNDPNFAKQGRALIQKMAGRDFSAKQVMGAKL